VTYHPDSVLVEKVAKARFAAIGPLPPRDWDELAPSERVAWRTATYVWLSVACPLVAGVIADRLDEETGGDSKDRWAAAFVRREFVDGEA
jgi:hypothetical protein